MRRYGLVLTAVFLIIFYGCSDTSVGGSDDEQAVTIEGLSRGEILRSGDPVELEFTVNGDTAEPDRLVLRLTDSAGNVITEQVTEESPLTEYLTPFVIDDSFTEQMYSLTLEFYSLEEPVYSETREFFVTASGYIIKSINSYPPVLYPGGGGLLSADTDCGESGDCWLRWTLDGNVIAQGAASDGLRNIEIAAPATAGVYSLSLEVFPFNPPTEAGYGFESGVIKTLPVYVNTDQKTGINEFGPDEDFYTLFHFRGSPVNSAPAEKSGIEKLEAFGAPGIAVRNGILGYDIGRGSGFKTDAMMIPVAEGSLQSFSLMLSLVPVSSGYSGRLLGTGTEDGEVSVSIDALADGRVSGILSVYGQEYSVSTSEPVLDADRYSSVSFAIQPSEEALRLYIFNNGMPGAEALYGTGTESAPGWQHIDIEGMNGFTRLPGSDGLEFLVDEFGVYYRGTTESAVDPGMFRRSMELEYGNSLVYADGFDGVSEGIVFTEDAAAYEDSCLVIQPGFSAEFPPLYPGYEELQFVLNTRGTVGEGLELRLYADSSSSEAASLTLSDVPEQDDLSFSILFTPQSLIIIDQQGNEIPSEFPGDFSSVSYSLFNNNLSEQAVIDSVLITRKSINIPEDQEQGAGPIAGFDIDPALNISR